MRDRNSLRALAIAGEVGFGVAGPLVICTGLGWYLDGQWGTKPWLVLIGLGLGLLSMFATFYRLATAFPAQPRSTKRVSPPRATQDQTGDNPDDAGDGSPPPAPSGSTRSNP
ncbi:MAG TPA: AtpZ/AtpI family protein [Chloroflexia bacterium]|jgi:F0F1-type ATP synthase assembly protein I|nr:AtpZ/AtpI family protein [Chloroflexia bacterium]